MKKILAVLATVLIGLGALLLISAPSWAAEDDTVAVTKFDTTFVYQGDNTWTVITHVPNAAIHNIGAKQSWLCNSNNVGEGIEACVSERAYATTGEILGDRSCVYLQGDNPAWDTVPDTEKEVCAPLNPTPEPSATTSPTPSTTPTPEESASPTPSPSATSLPTATPTPTPEPSRTPEPSTTPSAPAEKPVASPSPTETPVAAPSAPGNGPAELARTGIAHTAQTYIWGLTFGALAVALGISLLMVPPILRSRRLSRRRH